MRLFPSRSILGLDDGLRNCLLLAERSAVQIIDLAAATTVCRPIAGPGTGQTYLGFNVDIARFSTEQATWDGLPHGSERVFFAAAGTGTIQLAACDRPLGPLQACLVTGDLAAPPIAWSDTEEFVVLAVSSPLTPFEHSADEADLSRIEGIQFPARRWGRSITNGTSPIATSGFSVGLSILEPRGGQVPWHHHPDGQNELYIILDGQAQMCIDGETRCLRGLAAIAVPGTSWHQLTNVGTDTPVSLIYCFEGSSGAPHWWQERDGVLPAAGEQGHPPLPGGAFPQCTAATRDEWAALAAVQF